MDQMVIFIRLFLGMGIIWYFEILAFALSDQNIHPNVFIFTDTLNMCQVRFWILERTKLLRLVLVRVSGSLPSSCANGMFTQ